MYLVGKRRRNQATSRDNSQLKRELLELTPLTEGQNLHLNLASSSSMIDRQQQRQPQQGTSFDEGESERQLQLVCRVAGSIPEANIKWFKHTSSSSSSPITNQQQPFADTRNKPTQETEIIVEGSNGNSDSDTKRGSGNGMMLISDSKFETQSLIRALPLDYSEHNNTSTAGNKAITASTLATNYNHLMSTTQWSSVRVHNISIEEHETVIKCSALNEKFSSSSSWSSASEEDGTLSTSIRLNITHVPSIKLELESTQTALGEPQLLRLNSDPDVTLLRDKLELNSNNSSTKTIRDGDYRVLGQSNNIKYHSITSYATSNGQHYNQLADGQQQQRPVIVGQNVTLVCNISFANPALTEPIEWYLNHNNDSNENDYFQTIDKVDRLVNVVERVRASSRYSTVEKLIVKFTDRLQSLNERVQLKCKARNALGQAQSNTIKIVTGLKPKCSTTQTTTSQLEFSPNDNNNNNNNLTDKDSFIQCPVISDKGSSTFHWLLELANNRQKKVTAIAFTGTTDSGLTLATSSSGIDSNGATTTTRNNATTLSSSSRTISASKLRLLLSSYDGDVFDDYENLKINCYASDKFGSNIESPCSTILIRGQRRGK